MRNNTRILENAQVFLSYSHGRYYKRALHLAHSQNRTLFVDGRHTSAALRPLNMVSLSVSTTLGLCLALTASASRLDVRSDLHFPLHARGTNNDGSLPLYKNPRASIEDRVNDLLPRMTIEEKVSQLYVLLASFLRTTDANLSAGSKATSTDGWICLTPSTTQRCSIRLVWNS